MRENMRVLDIAPLRNKRQAFADKFREEGHDIVSVPGRQEALALLVPRLQEAPDDLMRNVTLALWKLGDPETPLPPVLELAVNHHDPDVRANATLALLSILRADSAPLARDSVLVALTDKEPKVRLHAAAVASRFPDPALTRRIHGLLREEESPLVRASMARALGKAKHRESTELLVTMLGSPRAIETS